MFLYHRARNLIDSFSFISGPRLDQPGAIQFSRDLEDVQIGGNPADHLLAAFQFADFSVQIASYATEAYVRLVINGVAFQWDCTAKAARVVAYVIRCWAEVAATTTLASLLTALWFVSMVPVVVGTVEVEVIRELYQILNNHLAQNPLPPGSFLQTPVNFVRSFARFNPQSLRSIPAAFGRGIGLGVGHNVATALLLGVTQVNLFLQCGIRVRNTVNNARANFPPVFTPPVNYLPATTPDPTAVYLSLVLCVPNAATVVAAADRGYPNLPYRSLKGKNGVKRTVPLAPGMPGPVPAILENTTTPVHRARPLVKVMAPFGPWHLEMHRFVGESFAAKYIDTSVNSIIVAPTPGQYGLGIVLVRGVPFVCPKIPVPVGLTGIRGAPMQLFVPDKMLREFDIPKLTAPQADHDVFLQRLDQAARALRHEYKFIQAMCLDAGHLPPTVAVPQVVGLNITLNNKRAALVEDFLRGH